MTTDSSIYLSNLHKQIDRLFNQEEVRTLCFELGVDFDNVAGEGKSARIRELILQLGRREEIPCLIDLVRRERPNTVWTDVPAAFSLPDGLATPETKPPATANYYGPVTFNQQGQTVGSPQINAGDANIGHIGNLIEGDQIAVGHISNAAGIAIGRGAKATVTTTTLTGGGAGRGSLFDQLEVLVTREAPTLTSKVSELQAQAARGAVADDTIVAGLINDLKGVSGADGLLKAIMKGPEGSSAAHGPATSFVLGRL